MAQLFFTSSLIPNKKVFSLEQLFEFVNPADIILVFDTNLVIYYRDLYLNSKRVSTTDELSDIYLILRYLVEQIHGYDLEVNASIGVDESSRQKEDFSLNMEKFKQTQLALICLFSMDIEKLDEYIKKEIVIEPVITKGNSTLSKINSLSQISIFQNPLIISYVAALKIFILHNKLSKKVITPREAYEEFYLFLAKEINCIGATLIMFALHLFGGVEEFKAMLFTKAKASKEDKIHQLFNGAIDLIYPYIVNKIQEIFPTLNNSKKLIPVFVSTDKRLSTLHSLINTKMIFESSDEINYNPELTEVSFFDNMNWTNDDLAFFRELHIKDLDNRFDTFFSGGRDAKHLLEIVEKYEKVVFELLKNKK